ncbi:two-component system, chemotaxis family, sensor kinase CheA [Nocardioides lianchengensis]|uniref:histidine kinase n=2 Tax=Nocardioides lianchengensis TaxID=1045774 RepID=A0A1G6T8Y7_9ACTN|nr:two-component system, chemotaxis family, sensor kinase CheA [Nocardioides lianchengensis]
MEEMDEIVQEFLVESHENLDQLDRDLVALEQSPGSRELLGSIFRTIHTIKGTSGFLAFGSLEAVAHVGENLLARLRDGKMSMTPQTTDVLLAMVDKVRELLSAIEASGNESGVVVDSVVADITIVLEGGQVATAPVAAAPEVVEAPEPVAEAVTEPVAEPVAEVVAELLEELSTAVAEQAVEPEPEPAPAPVAEVPAAPAPAPAPAPAKAPKAEQTTDEPAARRTVAESSIRVDVDVLDTLMRLVGELVLTRNQIVRQAGEQADQDLARSSQRLNLIATELQEGVMKTRMQPIDHLWSKLPRVVRDLGAQCGKKVSLAMVGRETELDRSLLESVKDPLTHLVRNAVDHGLESPEERVAAGKSAEGTLTLRAYHEGGQVVVEVCDDGGGIDAEKIAAKAVQRGLRTEAQVTAMSQADILQLIFLPGFSTAAAVTNVSGRGVGMDVVRTNIEGIGGNIEVESVVGRGTTCRLRIPLTLAIVPALTVECAGDRYAIPQVSLLELVALDADRAATAVEDVNGASVYRLRGTLLPLVRLTDVLGVESDRSDGHVLIAVLQADSKRFGLVIDRVLNTEEIVVKPLGSQLKALGTYSGATILGDGRVALILDVQALARRALVADVSERTDTSVTDESLGTSEHLRMLIAGIGGGRRVAIPLSSVTRLENIPTDQVEQVGSREVVQYRGAILPLLRLNSHLGAYSEREGEDLVVVVYSAGSRSVAIVVDEIVDIVDDEAQVSSDIDDHGLLGSALIRDRIVEVLDVRAAILAADPKFYSITDAELAGLATNELQEAM